MVKFLMNTSGNGRVSDVVEGKLIRSLCIYFLIRKSFIRWDFYELESKIQCYEEGMKETKTKMRKILTYRPLY